MYCLTIIQQCMLVVDNLHVKIQYIYTYFFHIFKSCTCFVLSNLMFNEWLMSLRNSTYDVEWANLRTRLAFSSEPLATSTFPSTKLSTEAISSLSRLSHPAGHQNHHHSTHYAEVSCTQRKWLSV